MNRLSSSPVRNRIQVSTPKSGVVTPFVESTIAGGINTELDPTDIAETELQVAFNSVIRLDQVGRRPGSITLNTKPNSNQIITLATVKRFSGTSYLLRFTPTTLHTYNVSWSNVTGATLTGGPTDRFKVVSINDTFVFANGVDVIQSLNLTTSAASPLGNAPKYKYIAAFHSRIVAANLRGSSPNPVSFAWSGLLNFTEWNPVVDISAGSQPLVESGDGYTDDITGLFNVASQLCILRKNSIWLVNKQESVQLPFYIYQAVPNIGCDCPDSAAAIPNGLIWFNYKLGNVYSFTPGSDPKPLAYKIRRHLLMAYNASDLVQASYNPYSLEYSLEFLSVNSTVSKVFVYNFVNESWSCREYKDLSVVMDVGYVLTSGTYEAAVGTYDQALGTYDASSISTEKYIRVFGLYEGDILYEDASQDTDNGVEFLTEITSKVFQIPLQTQQVLELHIEFISSLAGSFIVQYSKDGGITFTDYKTVEFEASMDRQLVVCKKNIRTRNYTWKIQGTSGQYEITQYAFFIRPSKEERSSS